MSAAPMAGKRRAGSRGKWAILAVVLLIPGALLLLTWRQANGLSDRHELFVAIRANDAARVERLLKAGADPNRRDVPPPQGPAEAIDRMLNRHEPEGDQPTPLLAALYRLEVSGPNGNVATYVEDPKPAIVQALLNHGANVNASTALLPSPLAFAGMSGNTEVVGMLLRAGAPVNQADSFGHTPLLTAASQGRIEMLRYLIAHGADVHARTKAGETALVCAVRYCRQPDTVALLLAHRVDPNLKDSKGKTALFYARNPSRALSPGQTQKLPQVIPLLTAAGAR